jgi:hypothetical protein
MDAMMWTVIQYTATTGSVMKGAFDYFSIDVGLGKDVWADSTRDHHGYTA